MATQSTATLPASFGKSGFGSSPTGPSGSGIVATDTITELTASAGVTIDKAVTMSAGATVSGGTLGVAAVTATTVAATGAITTSGATAGSGYATGAGGAITQITSAATGVTLSKPCGQITTVALTTAAAAEERFTVTNTLVAATDCIALGTTYNGAGTPAVSVLNVAAGAFDIVITNLHASAALNAVMVINFAIVKAVAA